jgi:hypothetical protein
MKIYWSFLLLVLIFVVGCGDDNLVEIEEEFDPAEEIECEEEERGIECDGVYKPVCGWSGENVNCLVYPCANNYENSCRACNNRDVEKYTFGKCPINEGLYEDKKEGKMIEIAKKFVLEMGQYKNNGGKDLKIVGVGQAGCNGCIFVESEFYLDNEGLVNIGRIKTIFRNFEIVDTEYTQEAIYA